MLSNFTVKHAYPDVGDFYEAECVLGCEISCSKEKDFILYH